ncbi:MAG TPA: baseplate J/gp47 family protein [Candidatus Paceibacterota bacterium]|nr:baseplate J/gp47 family protein [Candidatus Paceibacterota bacterium]
MRTLDDIIPPSRRAQMEPPAGGSPPRMRTPRARFPYTTAFIALVVVLAALLALFYFSGAEVQVTPNQTSVSAAGAYTATVSGSLPFQIITAQKSATQTVPANGTKSVSTSAKGIIVISNTQSKAQTLINSTRFETPTGLIFRIHAAVTIPAGGSKSVTVYADQPGADYNIAPTSFTVPGLQGTPQFNEVTAKSSGPMTGGASGVVPVVDSAIESSAQSSLASSLGPDLQNAIAAQVPAGFVLLPGSATTSFSGLEPALASSTSDALVGEQGIISAVVFPNAALAAAIATANQSGYDGEPLTIQNPSALTLSPAGGFPGQGDQSFTFTLAGSADLLSTVDPDQIAAAVAGKTREAARVALTNFPAIKQAMITLRPFWKSAFPADPASITVLVEPAS